MIARRTTLAALCAGVALLGAACTQTPDSPATSPAAAISTRTDARCQREHAATVSASLGDTAWRMCWTVSVPTGLTLSNASFSVGDQKPIPVLRQAALAQIDVPYDDGEHEHVDLPALGTLTLHGSIKAKDCPDGILLAAPATKKHRLLCARITDAGNRFAWDDYDFQTGTHTRPGKCLDIFTLTPLDWYSYTNDWQFCDDGSIRVQVGASGTLAPAPEGYSTSAPDSSPVGPGESQRALNHYHNVFWRIEPDLGGTINTVGEVNTVGAAVRTTTDSRFDHEQERVSSPNRFWYFRSSERNADDHALQYDLDLHNDDPYRNVPGHDYANYDFYVTQNRSCEILAAGNENVGCGSQVTDFVDDEPLTHPVIWTQTGFHHVPRDEDQPIMDTHWQGFSLVPRDLFATNPLATSGPTHAH